MANPRFGYSDAARRVMPLFLLLAMAGCGDKQPANDTQVVARVNDGEITLSQLHYQMQREPAAEGSVEEMKRRALDRLVEQELLRQRAVESRLERDPDVMMRMQAARARILADAYVQHHVLPKTRLRPEEVESYFYANPALFRQRKRYQLSVFNLDRSLPPAVLERLETSHTVEAVSAVLRSADITFDVSSVRRVADQLPLSVVDRFAAAQPGDVVVLSSRDGSVAVALIEAQEEAGVSLGEARGAIENYLLNVRNQTAYNQAVGQLRAVGEVDLLGEFATAESVVTMASPAPEKAEVPPASVGQPGGEQP